MTVQDKVDESPRDSIRKRIAKIPLFSKIIYGCLLALICFLGWAFFAEIDEVSTGSGKVIPSGHEQIIQSLEGGIVRQLHVKEGEQVEAGQVLVSLDPVKTAAALQESVAKERALQATAARLAAEVNGTQLSFPGEVLAVQGLAEAETQLYNSRRTSLETSVEGLTKALSLVKNEIALTEPLVGKGAASAVEVLRLRRQENELSQKLSEVKSQYIVKAREDLAKVSSDLEAQKSVSKGRADALHRLEVTSPVRGIVKDVAVTTVGGVIPPNGKLMVIVPLDGQLLVEARFSPRDIAFIHPGQKATVKVTAYDYSIYGALTGEVAMISPDTVQDDVKRDNYYYRVYVRTTSDALKNKAGTHFPISPGMVTTVDVHTGSKTVLDYIIKPFNKVKEALRER